MARHRSYSIEFKRQVVQEFLGGEALQRLARRHDVSRNLIRVWVAKYEAGAFNDEFQAADLLQQYEAKIAALERLVGRQALENRVSKGTQKTHGRREAHLRRSLSAPAYVRHPRMHPDGPATFDLLRRTERGGR